MGYIGATKYGGQKIRKLAQLSMYKIDLKEISVRIRTIV